MTTQTLIDILTNRIKHSTTKPEEAQLLAEIVKSLRKLMEFESGDKK